MSTVTAECNAISSTYDVSRSTWSARELAAVDMTTCCAAGVVQSSLRVGICQARVRGFEMLAGQL